jgi:hypothetical protein
VREMIIVRNISAGQKLFHMAVCFICLSAVAFIVIKSDEKGIYDVQDEVSREEEPDNPDELDAAESMSYSVREGYVVLYEDGEVSVYDAATGDFLFETGWHAEPAIAERLSELSEGLYFSEDRELFDFLENYTS